MINLPETCNFTKYMSDIAYNLNTVIILLGLINLLYLFRIRCFATKAMFELSTCCIEETFYLDLTQLQIITNK